MPQTIAIAHHMIALTSGGEENVACYAFHTHVVRVGAPVRAGVSVDKGPIRTMARFPRACSGMLNWQFS